MEGLQPDGGVPLQVEVELLPAEPRRLLTLAPLLPERPQRDLQGPPQGRMQAKHQEQRESEL